jgi:ComF family protein
MLNSQFSMLNVVREAARHIVDTREGLLDLVYPPFCVVCEKAVSQYLCPDCVEKIQLIDYPYCRVCGAPSETARCVECREREFAFDSGRSAGVFEGVLREAIHALKYSFHRPVADPLGDLMAERCSRLYLAGKADLVVPVPIHRSRMLVRGFNQSEELARRMCARISLPVDPGVLYQARKTRHQVDLPQDQRESNVRGAFVVRDPPRIQGKRVLLIDDVFTTGATLNEAASVLKKAGATSVHVYTLARSV